MVRLEVDNYEGAVAVLELLEVMKTNEYNAVFGPPKRTKASSRGKGEITNAFPLLLCNHCTPTTHPSSVAQFLRDSLHVKQQPPPVSKK